MIFLKNLLISTQGKDRQNYPFNIPAFSGHEGNLDIELDSRVTFFVGENGSGKSTLLEAIAAKCRFNTLVKGSSPLLHNFWNFGI